MKKMSLWAVVAILFVSSLAVFAGCEKREYVEVYEVREGNWAYSDKVTFFWGDNADGLTLEQYAFDCKKVKVLKKVAAQTFPYESGEMLLNTELLTSDSIEDVELRQFAEQTKEKMSLKETEREKNAVFNQECIKKLGLTGRFILTGDLGRIVSQRANEYMTTEDYLAAIEASKSPLVKSLTYKRTDFEELEPELFPELTKPSDMYETTTVVSSAFFGLSTNFDENTYLTDEELDALKKFVHSAKIDFADDVLGKKSDDPAENEFLDYLRKKNKEQGKDADWLYKELEAFFGFDGYFYHRKYLENSVSYEPTYFYGEDLLDLFMIKAEEARKSKLITSVYSSLSFYLSTFINFKIINNI